MRILTAVFILLMSTNAFAAVVVVHPSNQSDISLSEIKKLYLGKKASFDNGKPAKLATFNEGNDIRIMFNTNVLNKTESMYTGYWAKLTFTGQATPPVSLEDAEAMKQFVANNPNAIGIIDESMVDDTLRVVTKF